MFYKTNLRQYKRRLSRKLRYLLGCLFIFFLCLIIFVCSLFFLLIEQSAAAPLHTPLAVSLVIDNSNSLFEKDRIGSDPNLLRIDAASLFIRSLGTSNDSLVHECGVIFFGTEAQTAVSLTPLTNEVQRQQLLMQITDPTPMGWTDHLAALELAHTQLQPVIHTHHPIIVMLTDGKPEWEKTPTSTEQVTYKTALQAKSSALAADGISLYIILLENKTTDNDSEIAASWRPLWQRMSEATPYGRFFTVRKASTLPQIYDYIVNDLLNLDNTGHRLKTAVAQLAITPEVSATPTQEPLSTTTPITSRPITSAVVFVSTPVIAPIIHTSPQPTALETTNSTNLKPYPVWLPTLLVAGTLLLIVFTWRWRWGKRPFITGTFHLLQPNFANQSRERISLDLWQRPHLTIGQAPSHVPLLGAKTKATLHVGRAINDVYEIRLARNPNLLLDNQPVTQETPLSDMAILDFGNGIKARYENLRLRRAMRLDHSSLKEHLT